MIGVGVLGADMVETELEDSLIEVEDISSDSIDEVEGALEDTEGVRSTLAGGAGGISACSRSRSRCHR